MADPRTQFGVGRRIQFRSGRGVVLLCLLLMALLAAVQVAHVHTTESEPSHCTLCMILQTAAPVAVAAAAIVLVLLGSSAPLLEPAVVVRYRRTRLFIRPPPSSR